MDASEKVVSVGGEELPIGMWQDDATRRDVGLIAERMIRGIDSEARSTS
jgi:hypothetical protein